MRTASASARARRGLTLVEVMLAVAIIGIGITAMVAAASRCLVVVRKARNYETARHLLARAELEKPLQFEEEIPVGTESFTFPEQEFRGFKAVRTVDVVGDEEDGLYHIAWRISWSDRGKAAYEGVDTYLYAPDPELRGTVESR